MGKTDSPTIEQLERLVQYLGEYIDGIRRAVETCLPGFDVALYDILEKPIYGYDYATYKAVLAKLDEVTNLPLGEQRTEAGAELNALLRSAKGANGQ